MKFKQGDKVRITKQFRDAFHSSKPTDSIHEYSQETIYTIDNMYKEESGYFYLTLVPDPNNGNIIGYDGLFHDIVCRTLQETFWSGHTLDEFVELIDNVKPIIEMDGICPICGARGAPSFNMFYCSNHNCQNGKEI